MVSRLPLEGVRVADFGQQLMAPYATGYLAWFGAEVIKMESKEHPDVIRGRSPARAADGHINKLCLSLNLRHPEGLRIAKSVVKISDMVVENFSPGTMERLGLNYAELRKVKPDIIMISGSGFGQTGPESGYRSWAPMFAAMGGLSSLTGYRDGLPTALRSTLDTMAGQMLAVAALTALLHHRKTGEGQYIDLAARDAVVYLIGDAIVDYSMNGIVPGLKGNDDDWASPHDCYPCKGQDEWVSIAVFTDEEQQDLCKAMGREELAEDPRFRDPLSRWENRQELDEIISDWTREHSAYEIMERLQAVGVAATPVLTSEQIFHEPHLKARGFIREMEHPSMGRILAFGPPWQLAAGALPLKWPGPDIGEHNKYVLGNLLRLTDAEISRLEKEGALT